MLIGCYYDVFRAIKMIESILILIFNIIKKGIINRKGFFELVNIFYIYILLGYCIACIVLPRHLIKYIYKAMIHSAFVKYII